MIKNIFEEILSLEGLSVFNLRKINEINSISLKPGFTSIWLGTELKNVKYFNKIIWDKVCPLKVIKV